MNTPFSHLARLRWRCVFWSHDHDHALHPWQYGARSLVQFPLSSSPLRRRGYSCLRCGRWLANDVRFFYHLSLLLPLLRLLILIYCLPPLPRGDSDGRFDNSFPAFACPRVSGIGVLRKRSVIGLNVFVVVVGSYTAPPPSAHSNLLLRNGGLHLHNGGLIPTTAHIQ